MNCIIQKLEKYCEENQLTINTNKTKILIFRKGPNLPKDLKFFINGKEIEKVNKFKYLGVVFTPQLKYYAHIDHVVPRAKSQIGMLFANTPIKEVKIGLAMKLFNCYVLPIFEYCSLVWTSDFRKSYDDKINAVLLFFLELFRPAKKNIE